MAELEPGTNAGAIGETSPQEEQVEQLAQTRSALLETRSAFTAEALVKALNRLADEGWNSVILPGFLDGYPIFSSPVWAEYGLKRQHPAFHKWDPFAVALDVAWKRDLAISVLHAPYLVGPGGKKDIPTIARHYPKWLAQRHPNRKKRLQETSQPLETYYCPVNQDYRRFLCDTMNNLLEGYPLHGLMIDLRHYPFYSGSHSSSVLWCYCQTCRSGTLRDLGFDPADVDFKRELSMVERWKEWQAGQMDQALAYIRMRALKARRTMRVLGLLTTDSGLEGENISKPLIHWKTWAERSLAEALVLDGYMADEEGFEEQLSSDLQTLPRTSLLLPMLPRNMRDGQALLRVVDNAPVPGFVTRFNDWESDSFDPTQRVIFDKPAFTVEPNPIQSVVILFEKMSKAAIFEEDFGSFLKDLGFMLTRADQPLSADRLMLVVENLTGLYNHVAEGRINFGARKETILRELDLATRLVYLAGCDLRG